MEEYKEKRRKEIIHKRIIKKEWMSMECENMELLRKQHECRKFYKKINMARKKFKPRVICKNGDESLTSNKKKIFDKWARHFDKLLNGSKYNECVTFTTRSSSQILMGKTQDTTGAPTTEEIPTALKKLKNNNSLIIKSLPDIVPAELTQVWQ